MLYLEVLIVVALVILNGVLAMSELAVVSSRPWRLRAMAERGVHGARAALDLATDPGRFLSTVQVGITLVGIVAGAFSGASLGLRLSLWFQGLGMPEKFAEPIGFTLIVTAITYVSLVVGELVPKQIALRNPEVIACHVARPMQWLSWIAAPIVWLLDGSGRLLIRLMGQTSVAEATVTDEEIRTLIAEAETAGVIESGERSMIAGVMRLGDRPVRAVMTPLTDVDRVSLADAPAELRRKIAATAHSRLAVTGENPDDIAGLLAVKDIADTLLARRKIDVAKLVKPAPFIPETMPAIEAIELFRGSAIHAAFVQDEYGRVLGLVTASDLLEAITGSAAADDEGEPKAVQRDDGSWLLSGGLAVDEMSEITGMALPARRRYETVAGLVLDALQHMPSLGETARIGRWQFEVVDLDGRRIDKVVASRLRDLHRPGQRAHA